MNTVLIIEDDKQLSVLLKKGIEEAGHHVTVTHDAETALHLIDSNSKSINIVVSDIMLPGMNGIELCRKVRKKLPNIPILMLTALGTTTEKIEGFDAGADDYLTKPFAFQELTARINALLRRSGALTSSQKSILKYEDLTLNLERHECMRNGVSIHLTPKEFTLLKYLMSNAERVVSRNDIQDNVWGIHFNTGTNFIDVYINYLRRKIDKDFYPQLIHTTPGTGYILCKNEEQ